MKLAIKILIGLGVVAVIGFGVSPGSSEITPFQGYDQRSIRRKNRSLVQGEAVVAILGGGARYVPFGLLVVESTVAIYESVV